MSAPDEISKHIVDYIEGFDFDDDKPFPTNIHEMSVELNSSYEDIEDGLNFLCEHGIVEETYH